MASYVIRSRRLLVSTWSINLLVTPSFKISMVTICYVHNSGRLLVPFYLLALLRYQEGTFEIWERCWKRRIPFSLLESDIYSSLVSSNRLSAASSNIDEILLSLGCGPSYVVYAWRPRSDACAILLGDHYAEKIGCSEEILGLHTMMTLWLCEGGDCATEAFFLSIWHCCLSHVSVPTIMSAEESFSTSNIANDLSLSRMELIF